MVLLARPAWALDLGPWIQGLTLSPFISENIEYDTNVFQATSRSKQDLISKTIPGLVAEYTFGRHTVSLGFRTEVLRFLDLETQNTEHHIGAGQLKLEFRDLLVNVRDDYTLTSDPPNTELRGRVESTTNILFPEVVYRLTERFYAGTNYTWTHVDMERTLNQLDRDEHLISGFLSSRITAKTDLRLTYSYGEKGFGTASQRDVIRHIVTLGLGGTLTAKLASTFRVGLEDRESERRNLKGHIGWVSGGDWTYKYTERTVFTLSTDRSVQESSFGDTLFFVSTTGTLQVTQRFGRKVSANLRVMGGTNDYPTKEPVAGRFRFRDDTLLGWGGGLEYEIQRWLRIGAEYSHSRRDSNFDDSDYKADKISGKITLHF